MSRSDSLDPSLKIQFRNQNLTSQKGPVNSKEFHNLSKVKKKHNLTNEKKVIQTCKRSLLSTQPCGGPWSLQLTEKTRFQTNTIIIVVTVKHNLNKLLYLFRTHKRKKNKNKNNNNFTKQLLQQSPTNPFNNSTQTLFFFSISSTKD